MIKTQHVNGARYLGALWIAGFLVAGCGTALAETDHDTSADQSAREVSNNFGELLKGMGQELKKVIDSDDRTDSKASEKDSRKNAKDPDDKSGGNANGR